MTAMLDSSLIARQPICNASLKLVGFELLYRMNSKQNKATIVDGDNATIDLILSAYNDLSIDDVVGGSLAFINFTSNVIIHSFPPLPPKQLVIELLEDQEVTPELIKALKQLRKKGYKVALDDFCLNDKTIPLVECTDIIKVDVTSTKPEEWENYIPGLTAKGITMLAEKVESYEIFEHCKNLGYELFQGYFFSKPKILSGKKISSNQLSVLNLLSVLNQEQVDFDEAVRLISLDADLSYQLLRCINSGMYSIPQKVTSIRQAIVILGLKALRNWINVIALSSLNNKPKVLLEVSMVRAFTCQKLGEFINQGKSAEDFFTVGLFSVLDAFFDIPLNELIKKLSLNKDIYSALVFNKGNMGLVLSLAIDHEQGCSISNKILISKVGITGKMISESHLWAVNEVKQLNLL